MPKLSAQVNQTQAATHAVEIRPPFTAHSWAASRQADWQLQQKAVTSAGVKNPSKDLFAKCRNHMNRIRSIPFSQRFDEREIVLCCKFPTRLSSVCDLSQISCSGMKQPGNGTCEQLQSERGRQNPETPAEVRS